MANREAPGVVERLRARTDEMVDQLSRLVSEDSPSLDVGALARCSEVVAGLGAALTDRAPERILVDDGRPHLRWRFGDPRVLLLGHFDTVWPKGTSARWPLEQSGGIARGPGAFDMKAGIVQLFFALSELDELDGISVLLTSDEEVGSPTSRALIEVEARRVEAVLVLEPSADGALKTERSGAAGYEVRAIGRSAHAGLDPEKGANAAVEIAHQIVAITALANDDVRTTVTPTVLSGGTTANTVPETAAVNVDVRARTIHEQERVANALLSLSPVIDGCSLEVIVNHRVPPLEASASSDLFDRARRIAQELSLPTLVGTSVGGGSDGNLTASLGIPTLDGLGAVGGNAHAEGEFVVTAAMPERAALVSQLLRELQSGT